MSQHEVQIPINELTTRLSGQLPAANQAAAEHLLREVILPWELRNYPDHPRRDNLVKVVGEDLAAALAATVPEARLAVLESRSLRDRVERTLGESIKLALQRYAIDHPARAAAAQARIESRSIIALSLPEVAARAAALASEIDQLEALTHTAGTEERDRLQLLHARMAAGAARSGSFATAAGQLADELRQLGEHPDELRVH